jgi:cation diffusion facilitator family transporter
MKSSHDLIKLGALTVCVNITLMVIKIATGLMGNSYALVADGIESACDIFSSLIIWAGFHYSLKPADSNHPYGHGKIESLAGIFSGVSLLSAAIFIGYNSIKEIVTPHYAPAWFTLPVLILVVVVKEVLSRKVSKAGESIGSQAIKGDAWHHRSDAITSAATAIGISIALAGGKGFEMADDWAALFACTIIVFNGVVIIKGALHEIVDGALNDETATIIEEISLRIPGVTSVEKVRIRKSGISLYADMHVRVPKHITIAEGHTISHAVKDAILSNDSRVKDIVIHIEPAEYG